MKLTPVEKLQALLNTIKEEAEDKRDKEERAKSVGHENFEFFWSGAASAYELVDGELELIIEGMKS
jgi:hypothetical protein